MAINALGGAEGEPPDGGMSLGGSARPQPRFLLTLGRRLGLQGRSGEAEEPASFFSMS